MIKDFTPRLYQETILSTCANNNTLVVLPTGLGKTAIAFMLAVQRLEKFPGTKILMLAPTKPLAEQHLATFKKHLDLPEEQFVLFTGSVSPEKREAQWKDAKLIFSTPQGLENDVISSRINMEAVSLLVFDEAHRATGEYSYVFVAKQYIKKAKYPRILGLTASPGSDLEEIKEVAKNLHIEEIEIRTDDDPDVKPYVQDVKVEWVNVELPPEFLEIKKFYEDFMKSKLKELKELGVIESQQLQYATKKDLLGVQASLRTRVIQGDKDFSVLMSLSVIAQIIKVQHALELIETQGVSALHAYTKKLFEESANTKVKAVKEIVRDLNFRSAFIKAERLYEQGIEHPKLKEMTRIINDEVSKDDSVKIIIFTQYRDSAKKINEELKGIKSEIFVGQAKKNGTGLSQKAQQEMLDRFKNSQFNILIATSVAEEGIDIPRVDMVMFYEPIPSAIRHIQRRGRTGRQEKGRVIVLVAKNTRDEAYKWSAFHKEKRMHRNLYSLKKKIGLDLRPKKDETLDKFATETQKIKMFIDHREKGSGVIKELIDLNVDTRLEQLKCADFILSSRVGVEYKKTEDFVSSIIDGRLLQQIKDLKESFERPLIIVEGIEDIYSVRNIHPNAIRGMLATIAVSYGIPIIYTKHFKETAALLSVIAKREQEETGSSFSLHGSRKPLTLKEQQEYFISSLPNVGPSLAKELLKQFGDAKSIVNASEEDLKKVDKLGDKIAKKMKDVLDTKYIG